MSESQSVRQASKKYPPPCGYLAERRAARTELASKTDVLIIISLGPGESAGLAGVPTRPVRLPHSGGALPAAARQLHLLTVIEISTPSLHTAPIRLELEIMCVCVCGCPSRVTQREKEREKESSPVRDGVAAAARPTSMDSVEEYTGAEGDDEMADTEVRA